MNIDFAKIQGQVREVLKSIGALKPGAVAAEPPADPDALDQRLDGAAPTEGGMAAAGAEAAAGSGGAGADGSDPEGEGGSPEPDGNEDDDDASDSGGDEGDEGDEGRPVNKSLADDDGSDVFGNKDLSDEEVRALAKSYGNGTGKADPEDLLKGGPDLEGVLASILRGMEDQQIILQALHDEITSLKAGQTATNRRLSKALTDLQPGAELANPPVPIPAPKAVTRVAVKALGEGTSQVRLTPDQIFHQMKAGTLTQDAAVAAARQARGV